MQVIRCIEYNALNIPIAIAARRNLAIFAVYTSPVGNTRDLSHAGIVCHADWAGLVIFVMHCYYSKNIIITKLFLYSTCKMLQVH